MNNHSLTWRDHMRFRYAFRAKVREDIKTAACLIAIVACYAVVGEMDYRDALQMEAEAHARNAQATQEQLIACLNGGATGLYTTDSAGNRHYIVCERPWTVSDENTGPRT
jgi:hypothetical protein